jgi:hypothetical protein
MKRKKKKEKLHIWEAQQTSSKSSETQTTYTIITQQKAKEKTASQQKRAVTHCIQDPQHWGQEAARWHAHRAIRKHLLAKNLYMQNKLSFKVKEKLRHSHISKIQGSVLQEILNWGLNEGPLDSNSNSHGEMKCAGKDDYLGENSVHVLSFSHLDWRTAAEGPAYAWVKVL